MIKSLSLRLLGRPSVSDEAGGAIGGLPEKAFLLMALLVLGPADGIPRAAAGLKLWEGSELAQCGANLRQLLFRVRRVEERAGIELFELDGDRLRLSPTLADCDVKRLLAVDGVHTAGVMHTLTKLYAGDLLAGYHETEPELAAWIDGERRRLRGWVTQLVLDGVPRVDALTGGIALRHLADLNPPSSTASRALLKHLMAQGKTWEARRYVHEVGQRLGEAVDELFTEEARQLFLSTTDSTPATVRSDRGVELPRTMPVPRVALMFPGEAGLPPRLALFAQALIEDITIALTRLRSFAVLASYTTAQIGRSVDAQLAEYYDLDYLVTTRLAGDPASVGGGTRLTVMLERVPTREVLWADKYTFSLEAGPARYNEITNTLAGALADKIERFELRTFETTDNPSAYASYLNGQQHLQNMDLPDIRRARKHFRDALDLVPDFAPALSGIAQSFVYEWVLRGGNDGALLVKARSSATRAVELDPLDGNGHRMLGRAMLFQGGFDESIAQFERARRLAPNYADLLCDFADTLMHNSDPEGANVQIETALRLNPLAPDAYWWASGGIKFFLGQYQAALNHLQRVKSDEPVLRLIAACAAMAGQPALAKSARIRALEIDPGFRVDEWIAVLPQKEAVHRNHYLHALKVAGFK